MIMYFQLLLRKKGVQQHRSSNHEKLYGASKRTNGYKMKYSVLSDVKGAATPVITP